jgi:hypothetical protein
MIFQSQIKEDEKTADPKKKRKLKSSNITDNKPVDIPVVDQQLQKTETVKVVNIVAVDTKGGKGKKGVQKPKNIKNKNVIDGTDNEEIGINDNMDIQSTDIDVCTTSNLNIDHIEEVKKSKKKVKDGKYLHTVYEFIYLYMYSST